MVDLTIPSVSYTDRDYESTVDALVRLIPFYTEEWTNHNTTDPGIVLIKLFGYVADVMHFYIDRRALSGFLPTAVNRPDVINLLKLIDFEPLGPAAATVDLEFTLGAVQLTDVTIPSGTQVTTLSTGDAEPQIFETTEDLIIAAGEQVGTVGARHGQTMEEVLEDSNGTTFQKRVLSSTRIIRESVRLFVDETGVEVEWEEIESLTDAEENDQVFEVIRNADDSLTIALGDNAQGKIPIAGAGLRSEYIVGGGVEGNVGADTIKEVLTTILFDGQPLSVSVTNPLSASGGEPEMTIEEAKRLGPRSLRALDRAVTREDIETLALKVPGVAKAKAFVYSVVQRIIYVYIAPAGGGQPSQTLLDDVEAYLETRRMAGTTILAQPPKYVEVELSGTVYVKSNYNQEDTETLVLANIDDYFDLEAQISDFGSSAYLSDIYALIDNTTGVEYVDITRLTVNPLSTIEYFVWTGDGEFSFIEIFSNTKDEIWTVLFLSATTFSLSGTQSGTQSTIGTVNTDYYSDNNEIHLRIDVTAIPMAPLDRATFRTSQLVGNSGVLENEIRKKGSVLLTFEGGL